MALYVGQGVGQGTVGAAHTKLLDLPVCDGVGEDVEQGDVVVVMRTGPALGEPGDQAGLAEPVATGCLVRIPLTQQADPTLIAGRVVNEVVLVSSLVVMLGVVRPVPGVHCDVMTNTVILSPFLPAWCLVLTLKSMTTLMVTDSKTLGFVSIL